MVMESVFFRSNKLTKPVECGENRPVEQVHRGTHTRGQGSFFSHLPAAALQQTARQALVQKTERYELQQILQTRSVCAIFFPYIMHFSPHTSPFQKKYSVCPQSKDPNPRGSGTLAYFLNTSPAPWGAMTCVSSPAPPPLAPRCLRLNLSEISHDAHSSATTVQLWWQ